MKKVAIMQPYFMPYIGYFQLINSVDEFIIYDNIQFSKKGWINRNRFLKNGKPEYFTLPLKKDSDFLNVNERFLSVDWENEKLNILRKIKENYRKAPFFNSTYALVETIINFDGCNLFDFIYNSIVIMCRILDINTPIIISSTLNIDHGLKGKVKVIELCHAVNASHYINPIGGIELYESAYFQERTLTLSFIKSKPIIYNQLINHFEPWLSIIDLLMYNSLEQVKLWLNEFEEIRN